MKERGRFHPVGSKIQQKIVYRRITYHRVMYPKAIRKEWEARKRSYQGGEAMKANWGRSRMALITVMLDLQEMVQSKAQENHLARFEQMTITSLSKTIKSAMMIALPLAKQNRPTKRAKIMFLWPDGTVRPVKSSSLLCRKCQQRWNLIFRELT